MPVRWWMRRPLPCSCDDRKAGRAAEAIGHSFRATPVSRLASGTANLSDGAIYGTIKYVLVQHPAEHPPAPPARPARPAADHGRRAGHQPELAAARAVGGLGGLEARPDRQVRPATLERPGLVTAQEVPMSDAQERRTGPPPTKRGVPFDEA